MPWVDARSVFISDLHLGWNCSRPGQILEILRRISPNWLYLVGDTFEWLQGRIGWEHPDTQSLLESLTALDERGCEIRILSGNHDFQLLDLRDPLPWPVVSHAIHTTAAGERLLVVHGDIFDCSQSSEPSLTRELGGRFYPALVKMGHAVQEVIPASPRHETNEPTVPWSTRWKMRSRRVFHHVTMFERFMAELATSHGCHGVVCGHIHVPSRKRIGGVDYFNCGDWVENQSCILESRCGSMHLLSSVSNLEAMRRTA